MPRSPFGRDLWNVYGSASHEAYRAEPATLTRERETRRYGTDAPHFTVHAADAARAIRAAALYEWQQREAGAGRNPAPGEAVTLHLATCVPVLVPPPRW